MSESGPLTTRLTPFAFACLAVVVVVAAVAAVASVPTAMRVLSVALFGLALVRALGRPGWTRLARSRVFDVAGLTLLGLVVGYLSFGPDL